MARIAGSGIGTQGPYHPGARLFHETCNHPQHLIEHYVTLQ